MFCRLYPEINSAFVPLDEKALLFRTASEVRELHALSIVISLLTYSDDLLLCQELYWALEGIRLGGRCRRLRTRARLAQSSHLSSRAVVYGAMQHDKVTLTILKG